MANAGAKQAWEIMQRLRVCMLVTAAEEGLRARPMSAIPREDENAVYFLTDGQSPKENEIEQVSKVCLAYSDPEEGDYLSVSGTARSLNDRNLIKELWSAAAEIWWDGPDDPAVRVLKVTPELAQAWSGDQTLLVTVAMVGAAVSRDAPEGRT